MHLECIPSQNTEYNTKKITLSNKNRINEEGAIYFKYAIPKSRTRCSSNARITHYSMIADISYTNVTSAHHFVRLSVYRSATLQIEHDD